MPILLVDLELSKLSSQTLCHQAVLEGHKSRMMMKVVTMNRRSFTKRITMTNWRQRKTKGWRTVWMMHRRKGILPILEGVENL